MDPHESPRRPGLSDPGSREDLTARDVYQRLLDHVARDGKLSPAERGVMMRIGLALAVDSVAADLEAIQDRLAEGASGELDPVECYRHVLAKAWENGVITSSEQGLFASVRRALSISPLVHEKLLPEVCGQTPHTCGKCKAIVRKGLVACPSCLCPL